MDQFSHDLDPDLAVEDADFDQFADLLVQSVLGSAGTGDLGTVDGAIEGVAQGVDHGADHGLPDVGDAGSVVAGEGGDAVFTLPDGTVSFTGSSSGGFGDVGFSSDLGAVGDFG